jgi:hypothetical protein
VAATDSAGGHLGHRRDRIFEGETNIANRIRDRNIKGQCGTRNLIAACESGDQPRSVGAEHAWVGGGEPCDEIELTFQAVDRRRD